MWNPQRSSKGKDPSRQTSASHKGSLSVDSCPPLNESTWQSQECLDTNSILLSSPSLRRRGVNSKDWGLEPLEVHFHERGCLLPFNGSPHKSSKLCPLYMPHFEEWWEITLVSIGQQKSWVSLPILINHTTLGVRSTSGFSSLICKISCLDVPDFFQVSGNSMHKD